MKKLILLISIFFLSETLVSQTLSEFQCGFTTNSTVATGSSFRGSVKPNRTDSSGSTIATSDSYFPVLVVFVQFKNEGNDPRNTWPQNDQPVYLDKMIAKEKSTSGGGWWNWYDTENEILSSHWMEISRGVFHVISPTPNGVNTAFSVVLPHEASYYAALGGNAEIEINKHIWLSIDSQGVSDWRMFDRWSYNSGDGKYYFNSLGQGDGYVDMIYKIHKSRGVGGLVDYAGYNVLAFNNSGLEYLVDTTNSIKINYGNSFIGSGVTVSFRGQMQQYVATIGHEHGHQLFSPGGHSTYSRTSFGMGFEGFYSPADMILNKYMTPTSANINMINYLGDYSSRSSSNGEILKVPISGNEYFLLASRNKYSKWDRVMTGDTAQVKLYDDYSDYGKGLYIYHVPNGLNFPGSDISQQDMECADGLFEWEYAGLGSQQVVHDCFASAPTWEYFKKTNVVYKNDSLY